MNTKLLRQKILDLAIRGKLTDQRKSDGTAADLLKDIVEAKSKKNGVILSGARSAKSKDPEQIIPLDKGEAPFEIPENWEWVRLGDVASLCLGKMLDKSKNKGTYCRYLRNVNIRWGEFDFSDIAEMKFEDVADNRFLIKYGDLVMCEGGEPGRCAVWTDSDTIHFQKALHRIRFFNGFIPKFYQYLFFFYANKKILDNYFTGSTIKHLTGESLREIPIPLPPLAEQQRIVAKIEEAFAEIDAIEKNKELLKTHIKQTRQKILDLAIHGKLVPQNKSDEPAIVLLERITRDNPHYEKMGLDERRETKDERDSNYKRHSREGGNLLAPISKDEIPFDIPENWIWCRLGDILAPMQSTTPKGAFFKYIDIDAIDNSTCRIKAPKMIESKNAPSRASRFTKKGDILFSLVRPYLRNIAKVTENDCIASTGFFVCSPIIVNSDFCFFLLTSNYVVDGLNQFMKGDNSPSISSQNLIDFTIPLPPLNEQSRIVTKIEELFSTLDQMERNLV